MKYEIDFCFDTVLPNSYLPNALPLDQSLINYIVSINTTKYQNQVFINPSVIDLTDMFDEMGTWPNSLDGFFYSNPCYRQILKVNESSLFFYLRDNDTNNNVKLKKFIYPIRLTPHFDNFVGHNLAGPGVSKLNGTYFWKNISRDAMQQIMHGNGFILLDYCMEPFISKESFENLHEILRYSNIPPSQIILCVNSFNTKELYEQWFPPENRLLKVFNLPHCLEHSSWYYSLQVESKSSSCLHEISFRSTRNYKRPHHFLMKIKSPRMHRFPLLYALHSNDSLKYGDWSFLSDSTFNEQFVDHIINYFGFEDLIDKTKVKELHKTAPHFLKRETEDDAKKVNAWTDTHYYSHLDSYFDICYETFFDKPNKSLTEKIFKPIVNFQPFLFVAYPGALEVLRNVGFRTFDGYIDESYDLEQDPKIRFRKIYNEIQRLCSMTTDEIHEWFWSMEEILVHNHNTLINYHKGQMIGEELVKYLYDVTHP